jgi:hypothetical protein
MADVEVDDDCIIVDERKDEDCILLDPVLKSQVKEKRKRSDESTCSDNNKKVPPDETSFPPGWCGHGFRFQSAYRHFYQSSKSRETFVEVSTYHDRTSSNVDYILFDPQEDAYLKFICNKVNSLIRGTLYGY